MQTSEYLEPNLDPIRHTDIYLIDLILKRTFNPPMKILDAGCGMGRNAEYFLQAGYEVFGADISIDDIAYLAKRAESINPALGAGHFRVEALENLSFAPESMDVVICSAVLHFAKDEAHFMAMVERMWQVLKPGGVFFSRLASSVGIENEIIPIEGRRYQLPDGSKRFLVDMDMLKRLTLEMNATYLEPLKTVQVHGLRSMSNWILRKG